jgi:hypothetical protein
MLGFMEDYINIYSLIQIYMSSYVDYASMSVQTVKVSTYFDVYIAAL